MCLAETSLRAPLPITWLAPLGDNNYNGLSARLEHRFSHGLYFLDSFTWSKALRNSEQALETYAGYYEANPQNIRDLQVERGPTSFDVELMNVASLVYDLPLGKGRGFGSNCCFDGPPLSSDSISISGPAAGLVRLSTATGE